MPKIGPGFKVRFRREREGRTDYRARLKLLRSGKPRLVVRMSLNHVIAQVVRATPTGDLTLAAADSKELDELGWKCSTSNLPAAYLVGMLCGYRAKKVGIGECIFDIGAHTPTPQAKVFSALKGALDAGLKVPCDEGVLPADERIKGEHIARYAEQLKSDEATYKARFSRYLERGLPPEKLPEHFDQVKQAVIAREGG